MFTVNKNYHFKVKSIEKDSTKPLAFISGLASTFSKDRDGDIIRKGAFSKTLTEMKEREHMLPLLLSHDFSLQVGGIPSANFKEVDSGLEFSGGMLDLNLERSRDAASLIENKFLNNLSISFLVPEGGYSRTKDGLSITELELLELSIVPVPANTGASLREIKALGGNKKTTQYEYQSRLLKAVTNGVIITQLINMSI